MNTLQGRALRYLFRLSGLAVLALLVLARPSAVQSQSVYPDEPVRIIVPTSAGGVTDVLGRLVADGLSKAWDKPVIVDNRPGAANQIGLALVARSKNDGHTLLVASDAAFTAGPHIHKNANYDTVKDFTPILILGQITPTFNVPASLPVNSIEEFVKLAKSKPSGLNYASFGIGTYAHLAMEDLKQRVGMAMEHIPYRGSTPATTALLRGDVAAMIVNLNVIADHAKAGKVKILAAAGPKRSSFRPDLPTISETVAPGFSTGAWWGVFGPADLPQDVVRKIRSDARSFLNSPETRKFFAANTIEPVEMSQAEFADAIRADRDRWGALIRSVGIEVPK